MTAAQVCSTAEQLIRLMDETSTLSTFFTPWEVERAGVNALWLDQDGIYEAKMGEGPPPAKPWFGQYSVRRPHGSSQPRSASVASGSSAVRGAHPYSGEGSGSGSGSRATPSPQPLRGGSGVWHAQWLRRPRMAEYFCGEGGIANSAFELGWRVTINDTPENQHLPLTDQTAGKRRRSSEPPPVARHPWRNAHGSDRVIEAFKNFSDLTDEELYSHDNLTDFDWLGLCCKTYSVAPGPYHRPVSSQPSLPLQSRAHHSKVCIISSDYLPFHFVLLQRHQKDGVTVDAYEANFDRRKICDMIKHKTSKHNLTSSLE